MTIKEQMMKIKDNWLIAVLLVFLVFMSMGGSISNIGNSFLSGAADFAMEDSAYSKAYGGVAATRSYIAPSADFAPEVEQRVITKSASMNTEVKRGTFAQAEETLKSIVKSSGSYLLSDSSNVNEEGVRAYRSGYYNIKVESDKYDAVLTQLKNIGKVLYFNQNADDITGRYTDLNDQLKAEQERIKRYEQMYDEAKLVEDKLQLSDRIFSQERTIEYLKDAISNMDKKVSYSTLYVSLTEERSNYADIIFVKVSDLVKGFVGSLNLMLKSIFAIVPWALGLWVVIFVKKKVSLRKGKKK